MYEKTENNLIEISKNKNIMNKFSSLLSICQASGGVKSGEFACEKALQNNNAFLVIVAIDASNNTKKKFCQKSFYYETPYIEVSDKILLGSSIGKDARAVVAILDQTFAEKIQTLLQ